ncbi:MAG: hypothetical protein IJV20_08735 [Prevotella sp.]|nr:hypothetical protein [Prevotella sp.]
MKKLMMTIAMMAMTVCMMAANNTAGDFPEKVTTDHFTFTLNTKKWKYNGSQKNESIRIQTINDPKISVNISTSTIAWEHWKNAKSKSYTAGKVVKKSGKSFETFFSGSPEEGSSKYSFGMWAGIPINPKGNIEIYIMGRKNPDQKPKDLVYPILDEVLSMLKFK